MQKFNIFVAYQFSYKHNDQYFQETRSDVFEDLDFEPTDEESFYALTAHVADYLCASVGMETVNVVIINFQVIKRVESS